MLLKFKTLLKNAFELVVRLLLVSSHLSVLFA